MKQQSSNNQDHYPKDTNELPSVSTLTISVDTAGEINYNCDWDSSEEGIIGIGSGGNYALAAAKVLMDTDLSAEDIAKKAIKVASDICVFTNNNIKIEKI